MTLDGEEFEVRQFERPEWMERAACRGMDPDLFFPGRGAPTNELRGVCAACSCLVECRAYSLHERFGFWGGMSEKERRKARAGLPVRPVQFRPHAPCGTYGAYARHLRRKEAACDACKEANVAYQRERKAEQRRRLTLLDGAA